MVSRTHIASVEVFPVRLPTRGVLRLPRGPVSDEAGAPHVFVRVRDAAGREGWGEARPSHYWSDETEESVVTTIRAYLAPAVIGRDPLNLLGLHQAMDGIIAPGLTRGQPIAKSAVDLAVHDLLGQQLDLPVASLFGRTGLDRLPLCWTVSAASPAEAEEQARVGRALGYRGFKVKLGVRPELDRAIVEGVRDVDRAAFLWADANQSYELATARRLARALGALDVDVFEQPTPARDVEALRRLRADGSVPIAVDESVFSAQDLLRLIRLDAIDVLVVKLCKLGGIWPARRCLDLAEEAGIPILASGLTESGIGIAAGGALFGGYKLAGPVDFNGPQLLDFAPGVPPWQVEEGALVLPPGPGLGVRPDVELLAARTQSAAVGGGG
jgi:muconate cycloisomerase